MIQKYDEEITRNNTIKSTTEISVENCSRMISSSSSISTTAIEIVSSPDKLNEAKCNDGVSETNGILNREIEKSDHQSSSEQQEECVDGGANITTKTSSTTTTFTTTTNGGGGGAGGETKSNANTPDSNKGSDVVSHFTMTPTTKLPPPEAIMQRPLKPQTEMDFLVPYNIINNYFSVGVVSVS